MKVKKVLHHLLEPLRWYMEAKGITVDDLINEDHDCHASPEDGCDGCQEILTA